MNNVITFKDLYVINIGWRHEQLLYVFFEREVECELIKAKEALEKYGKCTVGYFNGNTVVLEERLG